MQPAPPLLAVHALDAFYGSAQALAEVAFDIHAGEALAVLGRNGMGKTTTVRALAGLVSRRGSIRFAGEEIIGDTPERIARRGLAIVPEGRQIFPNLSVDEHLTAFARHGKSTAPRWTRDTLYPLFPPLASRARHLGGTLSGGEQQMLAIARALSTHPKLVVLDEATEGLAPAVREDVWRALAAIRESGTALLVIDKYAQRLAHFADRAIVLEKGRVAWRGSGGDLVAAPEVMHRLLGV